MINSDCRGVVRLMAHVNCSWTELAHTVVKTKGIASVHVEVNSF